MSGAVQSAVTVAGRGCVAALALALVLHGSTKHPPLRQSAAPTSSPVPAAHSAAAASPGAWTAAGVFAIRARTVCGTQSNEVEYVHREDEPYVAAIYGRQGPNRKGGRNHIGVASSDGLLTIRNTALKHLCNVEYAVDQRLDSRGDFSSVGDGQWKCNAFVADVAIESGFPVPVLHVIKRIWPIPDSKFPPVANEWASGIPEIIGWLHLDEGSAPEPGQIAARLNPNGSGHCGVVDYDGWVISARRNGISRNATQMLDGSCRYNIPKIGEEK